VQTIVEETGGVDSNQLIAPSLIYLKADYTTNNKFFCPPEIDDLNAKVLGKAFL
jgi:hypothetical protein